jgi:drug/metabolite transporter (DMT)-like permease
MRPSSLPAIVTMIFAMMLFALMNSCIRFSAPHIGSAELVFFRNFFAVMGLGVWLTLRHREEKLPSTKRFKSHFFRASLGIISMEMWFYVVARMPLNEATALSFTAPLFASIIAMIAFKESLNFKRIAALGLGFSGMLVILQPNHLPDTTLALMALSSAFMMAIGGTLIKSLTRHEHPDSIVFMQAAIMTPLAVPMAALHGDWPSWEGLSWAVGVACFSVGGHLFLTRAMRSAEMVVLMPFDYTRLIFTSIFAWWWFNETLNLMTALGACLILGGSLWSVWLEKRQPI